MLPPLQQSNGQFATDQLRSMLEDVEARRKEAEDKAAGKDKNDRIVGTHADPVSAAANEKINAHFFGAMKGDPDPMATLIARFASAVGLSQGHDESSKAFAQRLSDAVAMLEYQKADSLGKPVKISLKSLGVPEDDVIAILNGTATTGADPASQMAARIAKEAGLTGEEKDFGEQISAALMSVRATLPENVDRLEEKTGLKELGLKAQDVIDAIANPWGEAARKVKAALAEKAEEDKSMTREMRKVLQRLEDVADPKTVEELKERDTRSEPGRVEDAETKAERKQDIQNLENAEKLDDVREQQVAVKDHLDEVESTGDTTTSIDGSLQVIQVLASQAVRHEADNDDATNSGNASAENIAGNLSNAAPGAQAENEMRDILQLSETIDQNNVLVLPVDDIGIYDLLRRKAA
ncbi:hypothetical protein J2Y48_000445 [Mycoplana sp. BE70]|uniref:hypothetical protein n=1 Tax=Mycoplana sp. BE70 TaxID=2817775 RepID=UPI0028660424|nr:hypothetical protein [Mycoplana sp. BE70]MDR6755172.1 hypothetical protein [Mycoplana sp. BE70]